MRLKYSLRTAFFNSRNGSEYEAKFAEASTEARCKMRRTIDRLLAERAYAISSAS